MTQAAPGRAEDVADLARRRAGRATPQRVAVLEAVLGRSQHLSVQQIHHECEQRGVRMRLSTVYRVLTSFEHSDLVHAVPTPDGMSYGPRGRPHIHAVCLGCSLVIDVDPEDPDWEVASTPFTTLQSDLVVTGLCPACRQP